jgi:flagellar motor protein MotB
VAVSPFQSSGQVKSISENAIGLVAVWNACYVPCVFFHHSNDARTRISIVFRVTIKLALGLLLLTSGCGRLVFKPKEQASVPQQQQVQTLAQQNREYQSRAQTLDSDNQELESLLAQSRQQARLLNDELSATRSSLKATTDQLVALRSNHEQLRGKTTTMLASTQKRSRAEIRANNSLLKNLTVGNLPGVEVRQDGDVVRVEVPGVQLFTPGSNYLINGADPLLQNVAADLRRNFPDQIIGIEGHTDNTPTHSQQFPSNHHLSAAQALAVYNALIQQKTLPERQLFVIGHGSNHPAVSNATEAGKVRNRRIEFVIYPERIASR